MYEFNVTMMQAFTVQYIIYKHMLYIILLSTGHGISYVITLSVSEFMNGNFSFIENPYEFNILTMYLRVVVMDLIYIGLCWKKFTRQGHR